MQFVNLNEDSNSHINNHSFTNNEKTECLIAKQSLTTVYINHEVNF